MHNVIRLFVCGISTMLLLSTVKCSDQDIVVKELRETIAQIPGMKRMSIDRANAGERLGLLTTKVEAQKVDDDTLAALISLLDISDNSVRIWAAIALGNLGSRASSASTKLLQVLPEVDCVEGAVSPGAAIRHALKRIGITPPPRQNCGGISG